MSSLHKQTRRRFRERERGRERRREREREGQTDWLEGMLGYAGVRTLFPSSPKPYFLLLSANRTMEKAAPPKSNAFPPKKVST